MPAKSKAQANLFRAAEHGATFDKATQLRDTLTKGDLHDFAATPSKNLPARVSPGLPRLSGRGQ